MDARRAIAWWRYIIQTSPGIAQYNPNASIYNPDEYNILVNGPLLVKNVNVAALTITNGVWGRLDGILWLHLRPTPFIGYLMVEFILNLILKAALLK